MLDGKQTNQNVVDEIKAVSEAWGKAILNNNADAIANFMTDDWTIIFTNGITTRERFLGVVASGDLIHTVFEGEIITIREYGDMAVVTSRMKSGGTFKNHPFYSEEWTTDMFINQNRTWRCVHSQVTPIQESK